MGQKTVAANIVTYNRINELKRCLEALRNQSYKDFDVIVVNNGSTDGTLEFLEEQTDLIVINQTNLGSSGGQYAGMRYMFENGYEWFWTMDDDGIPEPSQLENLMKYSNQYKLMNALVVDKDNKDELAFATKKTGTTIERFTEPVIESFVHPFNGTLISREVIQTIGFVKKEMFIWGDEREYMLRAMHYGIQPVTITNAIHYHPKEKGIRVNVIPFCSRFQLVVKPENLSKYYYRNQGYITKYFPHRFSVILYRILCYSIYYVRTFQFTELRKFYKYFFKGIFDNSNEDE